MDKELYKPPTANREAITDNINNQVRALNESTALYNPDPHAGNILVDPVIIAALDYYWDKLKPSLISPPMEVLSEEQWELVGKALSRKFSFNRLDWLRHPERDECLVELAKETQFQIAQLSQATIEGE